MKMFQLKTKKILMILFILLYNNYSNVLTQVVMNQMTKIQIRKKNYLLKKALKMKKIKKKIKIKKIKKTIKIK